MKIVLILFSAGLFFVQPAIAQNSDAQRLPLRILFHKNEGGGLGLSPNGKNLIDYSESENATVLWNLETERIVWRVSLAAAPSEIAKWQDFVWSDNEQLIAVAGDSSGRLYLLNAANGTVLWKAERRNVKPHEMRFVAGGKFLAVSATAEDEKAKIELWNVETGKLEKTFETGLDYVNAVALDEKNGILKFGGADAKVSFVNSADGKILFRISLKPCGTLDKYWSNHGFSPNLKYFAARCQDKTVISEVVSGKAIKILDMDTDFEKEVEFSDDERLLIMDNLGGYKIYSFADRSVREVENGEIGFLNFDASLTVVGSSYKNRGLEVREVKTGKLIKYFESHPGEIKNLAFSADGSRFASASSDGVVRVWETATRKLLWAKFANDRGTNAVAFSPDGKTLLSSGRNESDVNPINIWNAENGDLRGEITSEDEGDEGISRMKFSPDGKLLLTTSKSVVFKLWNTENWTIWRGFRTNEEQRSGNWVRCCGSPAVTVDFDRSSKRILSAHQDGTVKLWNIDGRDPAQIFQVSNAAVRAYFSPDEKQILVVGMEENSTKLIDAATGKVVQEYQTGNPDKKLDNVTDAAFRADGKSFLTASWFDDVMLWDAGNGKLIKRINVGWSTEDELEMSADGKYFLTGGENQNIMLFDAVGLELVWSLFPINKSLRRINDTEEEARLALIKRRENYAAQADVENRERVKKVSVNFSHYGTAESFWNQKIAESGVPDKSKLKLSREKASVAWFTLTNDSELPVSIETNSMMFDPKCKGLCDGAEISARYVVELPDGESRVNGIDMYSSAILPPQRSVYFSVALEHFVASRAIYLGFTFQKDNPDDENSGDYGTEQKIYLPRETDLPK